MLAMKKGSMLVTKVGHRLVIKLYDLSPFLLSFSIFSLLLVLPCQNNFSFEFAKKDLC